MILNKAKERIVGVVKDPDVKTDYTGVTTSTAKVTIDPETKEIKVDVIASGLLGETATTAYPGNDGVLATKLSVEALERIQEETERAKHSETELNERIESFTDMIMLGDAAVHSRVEEETDRALKEEHLIREDLHDLKQTCSSEFNTVYNRFVEVDKSIKETDTRLSKDIHQLEERVFDEFVDVTDDFSIQLSEVESNLLDKLNTLDSKQDKHIAYSNITYATKDELNRHIETAADNQKLLSNRVNVIEKSYATQEELDKETTSVKSELTEYIQKSEENFKESITDLTEDVSSQFSEIKQNIDEFSKDTEIQIDDVHSRLTQIESTYATKTDVHVEVNDAITLSKQLVDSIDLVNNIVVIDGVITTPVDGVLYMLLDTSVDVQDIYKEYTTIEGNLTLIGDTSVSLDGYATETFVKEQIDSIPEVDLTDYAKKSEIPDVSSFIAEIPEEYITEEELDEKGFYTLTKITDLLKSIEFIDGGNAPSI